MNNRLLDLKDELTSSVTDSRCFDLNTNRFRVDCIGHWNLGVKKILESGSLEELPAKLIDGQARTWAISFDSAENQLVCECEPDNVIRYSILEHLAYALEYTEADIDPEEEQALNEFMQRNNFINPVLHDLVGFDRCRVLGVLGTCRVVSFDRKHGNS